MTFFLWNLGVYSLQLAALAAGAVLATQAIKLRAPRFSWRFWQLVMLAAIVLPVLQPRREDDAPLFFSTSAVTATSAREALAARIATDWTSAIAVIVAAGIVIRLLWLLIGLARVRVLIAAADRDAAPATLASELNATLGTRAAVMISNDLQGPATFGVRRPIVLLPRSVLHMSPAVQRAIVCHELIHVIRRDWLHTIAEELWCALLWFHPAARVIASRVSLARETVVDELTIKLTRNRRAYAEALLAFSDPQPHVVGLTPFIGRRTLAKRIALIADEIPWSRRRAILALMFALAASTAVMAATIDRIPMASIGAQAERVYRPGPADGVSLPVVVKEVKPRYTRDAMREKIQGSVWLECVVDAKGDITDVKVTKSLDAKYGLDDEAISAARQWKFKPGQKDGKPVAVIVTIQLTFTLKK